MEQAAADTAHGKMTNSFPECQRHKPRQACVYTMLISCGVTGTWQCLSINHVFESRIHATLNHVPLYPVQYHIQQASRLNLAALLSVVTFSVRSWQLLTAALPRESKGSLHERLRHHHHAVLMWSLLSF
jgi:hypothetical protein